MAESTSKPLTPNHQRSLSRSAALIDAHWPGGVAGAIADYQAERASLKQIMRAAKLQPHSVRRFFKSRGVQLRDPVAAGVVGKKLNPDWRERISKAKRLHPFRHSPGVTAVATAKRVATVRSDPSRHGNAHAKMTNRERQFADMLDAVPYRYEFNKPAAHYFLDFYLPDLSIGVEVQRSQTRPERSRDAAIIAALGLKGILYVPTWYLREGLAGEVAKLVRRLYLIDPAMLGDRRYLCMLPGRSHITHEGIRFMARWAD